MSEQKDTQDDHDPDYAVSGPSDEVHRKQYEDNARTNAARKITAIVEKEFSREIDTKEKEILQIEERLHKAMKTLHFLRYVIITDFYNRKQCQNAQGAGDSKQTRIHPAIKRMIGKSPRVDENLGLPSTSTDPRYFGDVFEGCSIKEEVLSNGEAEKRLESCSEEASGGGENSGKPAGSRKRNGNEVAGEEAPPKKIPRYVPPKSGIPEPQVPSRGARHKVRKRIVVGNISKWIPPDWREDAASHKWTMYVRGSKENAEIADFVGKVRFFLHPSYRPNDVVEVTSPPFHLSRRGWGEFPLRVQLHFKNPLNKPMDIIHYLKLDRTYTGLQTLGSETVVDVWIKTSPEPQNDTGTTDELLRSIKREPEDPEETCARNCKDEVCTSNKGSGGCCVRIKDEQPRDFDETASHVRLEHDYANPANDNPSNSVSIENNVTISHSPPRNPESSTVENSSPFDPCATIVGAKNSKSPIKNAPASSEPLMYEEIVVTSEKDANLPAHDSRTAFNGAIASNREFATISKEIAFEASGNLLPDIRGVDSSQIHASVDVQTLASSLGESSPKLQPLRISIPVTFEALKNSTKSVQRAKQILILKDNKLIPIDSVNFSKVGVAIGRGVSLLKKPPSANNLGSAVKKGETTAMVKLNPAKSLILNAANDIPVLKIADARGISGVRNLENSRKILVVDKTLQNRANALGIIAGNNTKDYKNCASLVNSRKAVAKPKITLGKDRIGATSNRLVYEEILRSIDDAKITDVSALVRFIIRRIPLISERATDPEYRTLHPYACASEKEFLDSNVGKQRALEWCRAKHVKSLLKKKGVSEDSQWSVKEIMIWSRLHGYTPMRCLPISGVHPRNSADKTSEKNIPGNTTETSLSTFTEPLALLEYLRNARETKGSARVSDDEAEIIDVESVVEKEKRHGKRGLPDEEENNKDRGTIVTLGIPEKMAALESYVTNTARQIGVKLGPEEIVPGVMHCASARVLVRTVQCLLEDLLRSSLAKAWQRSSDGGCPDTITLEDVRGAILSREEFDVFTNEGLGSHHCPDD